MKPSSSFRKTVETALPVLAGLTWAPLTGGRTNRLWRVGEMVVKSYDPAQASQLFPNNAVAEAAALEHFGPLGLAPHLTGTGSGWIAYTFAAGSTWREDPRRVALLLHDLHSCSASAVPRAFRRLPSGGAALADQARQIIAACRGRLPVAPPETGGIATHPAPTPIHADMVPGNLIDGPGGIIAIDWQCPAVGDPAEDLATFLSPAMQWLYRGAILSAEEIAAFLDAYPDQATVLRLRQLQPAFRYRMAAHCLWRAERGDADYNQALRLELA